MPSVGRGREREREREGERERQTERQTENGRAERVKELTSTYKEAEAADKRRLRNCQAEEEKLVILGRQELLTSNGIGTKRQTSSS